jgi:inner membrane protein
MDNLTHSLTGLALARCGLGRLTPRGTLLVIIAANIPDVDMLSLLAGPLKNLEIHRGYTHSLLFSPVMALIAVLLTRLFGRRQLSWGNAMLAAWIGVLSHLLLDVTNSYGVRLWLPFSSTFTYWDLNNLFDVVILVVLLLAALWPLLARLVSDEIGERRAPGPGLAIFALAFFVIYDVARFVLHQRAVAQLESRLYEGQSPLKVAAMPEAANPLMWRGVVETADAYFILRVPATGELDVSSAQLFYKGEWRPSFGFAAKTPEFHYLMYYSRFPLWREEPAPGVYGRAEMVELLELRFGEPPSPTLSASAVVNPNGQILESEIDWAGRPRLSNRVP